MKNNFTDILYIIILLSILSSCQYENSEELYYSNSSTQTDTTGGKKIIADIPFNNSITDESNNQLEIIIHGSPNFTNNRFNETNKAIYFNGEDEYIELDIEEQDSISVSFWFISASGKSNLSSLFDYGANAVKTNIDGYSGPTSFNVTTFYNNLDELNANYYFQYYTWYHVYVSACNNPVIYINGEKAGEIRKNIILNLTSTNLVFGKSIHEDTEMDVYFHGTIDDIKIYNFSLTETEINELYGNPNIL